jgi:hypothetical protein
MANNTWKNYTQKDTALSDNDEVMLLDSTDEKNKRGLMSKFWDYVVDKMATAVISKLETNNKTIIGAINALNSELSFISKVKYVDIQVVNEYVYTGLSFTVPKNTLFIFTAKAFHENSEPLGISTANSDSSYSKNTVIENNEKYPTTLTSICDRAAGEVTHYIWAKYKFVGKNKIGIWGTMMK